jgi:hypothetical protein
MAEDLDDYRRIFDGGDDLQGAAAVGAVLNVDVTRLSSRAQLMRENSESGLESWRCEKFAHRRIVHDKMNGRFF